MEPVKILSRYEFNQQYRRLNEKTEDQSYSYGCIMGYFGENPMDFLSAGREDYDVKEEDLYDNDEHEYGREIEPHVTLLYGLHQDIDEQDVIDVLKVLKMDICKFTGISCFKNDKFEVLKWDIDSVDLALANKLICKLFPYTNKFPDYHPHCTIAYLQPGAGDKYTSRQPNNIVNLPIVKWVYSMANGRKISVDYSGTVEVIREATEAVQENAHTDTKLKDQSFDYEGYHVSLKPSEKFANSYMCAVYKDGNYEMGLKGPVSLEKGREAALLFINGTSAKDESFDYRGYHVVLKQRFTSLYNGQYFNKIEKDGECITAIKGPVSLEEGRETSIQFIDMRILKLLEDPNYNG
jgi:hypothetical protein